MNVLGQLRRKPDMPAPIPQNGQNLASLADNVTALVLRIEGGPRTTQRVVSIGIRPGVRITRITGSLFRGPVTVRIGTSVVAVGHGIASRIIVETVAGRQEEHS